LELSDDGYEVAIKVNCFVQSQKHPDVGPGKLDGHHNLKKKKKKVIIAADIATKHGETSFMGR
jgi:hypothetical protein